jgi:hypothetical protein
LHSLFGSDLNKSLRQKDQRANSAMHQRSLSRVSGSERIVAHS